MRKLLGVAAGAAAGVGGMTISGAADAVPIGDVQASFQVKYVTNINVGFINVTTHHGLTGGIGPSGTRTNGLTALGGHLTNDFRAQLEIQPSPGVFIPAPMAGPKLFCTAADPCVQQPFGVSKTSHIDFASGHTFLRVDNFTANPFTNVRLVDVTTGNSIVDSIASIGGAVQTSLQGIVFGNYTFDLGLLSSTDTYAILLNEGTSTDYQLTSFQLAPSGTATGNVALTYVAPINAFDNEEPPPEAPEPASLAILGAGLLGAFGARRLRRA